jgi:hypothetical protein
VKPVVSEEKLPGKTGYSKFSKEISGPSIKAALSGKDLSRDKISVQEQFALFSQVTGNEVISESELYTKWAELLEILNDRPNLKSTLTQKPVLKNNNLIVVQIHNGIQEEMIKNNKPWLLSWLRKSFQNNSIDLTTELISEPQKRIIYTDGEKLDEMLRKNKDLALLKERFHLDFDT